VTADENADAASDRAMARPDERALTSSDSRRVVAVTGAQSFLGSNLIGLLEEDESIGRIVSIDRGRPKTASRATRVYELDLAERSAEERVAEILAAEHVDTLVHLAFFDSPTRQRDRAHELESVGTAQVVNACRRARIHKVVAWSQTLLYGAHPTNPGFLSERHPLRAQRSEPYFCDKIQAETELLAFGRPGQGRVVTVLRTAPIVGPTVNNCFTRYFSHRVVPTVLGFDPLCQVLHEADAVAAFKLAIDRDAPGVFNIAPEGVLPLGAAIRLVGRTAIPLPRSALRRVIGALWLANLAEAPASFLEYLQYVCVADTRAAAEGLGFRAAYTTREALSELSHAQHLREAKLLSETAS
jgi:UDP-glucose 4-epimerase